MSEPRPPAMFLADAIALDFLNSIATPVDVVVEWLTNGEDLLSWLEESGLVDKETLQEVRKGAAPGELDAVAAQARGLREWFRGFVREHKGKRLTRKALADLDPLNKLLARDEEFGQLVVRKKVPGEEPAASEIAWVPQRRWRSANSLMFPIAKAMADLIANADFTLVRACEWHTCTLTFLDTSNKGTRRWCSMAVCGNRAKQAAHRERLSQVAAKKRKAVA